MNQTICNFVIALNQIEEIDYITNRVKLVENEINIYEDTYSTYENNFVTKLNEKYAILLHLNEIVEPKELIRQFQIPKKYAYSPIAENIIRDSFNKLANHDDVTVDSIQEFSLIPDFIIHKNQADILERNQRLIVEVKTEQNISYTKFAYDFLKLVIYLNKFQFQNAIFLSVNTSPDIIKGYLKKYFQEKMYLPNDYKKLYIVVKENYRSDPSICNLQVFFDENFRKYR